MKCVLSVVVVLAVALGAFAIPSGYMYYKPGTPGIMYVQYQKPGAGSNGVSAFVAGDSGDTMTIVDDAQKEEDVLSETVEAALEEKEDEQSISVAQGFNSQSIAIAIPAEDEYDGEAKVEQTAEPTREYLPPNNEYLPPSVNEVSNDEEATFVKAEETVEGEVNAFEDVPVAIVESKITEEPAEEVKAVDEVHEVYGVPKVEETREPKNLEETPVVEEEIPAVEDTKTAIENEEVPVDDAKTVSDESTLVVEEPTPVVQDVPEPAPVPVPTPTPTTAPTKRTRVFPARRPNFVPQRKKVAVQLEEQDQEAVEYVPANRQVTKPKKEVVEEEETPFPLGGTFFPINFGGTSGGAIAIANSFSTGKGGSSKSQAVAYGNGSEAFRARKPVKHTKADCDC